MSKSLIYTVNANTQSVLDGGLVNLGTVVRRFGCNCELSGNGIVLDGVGYYNISVAATVIPAVAGTVTLTAYKDGVAIPGLTVSETVAEVDSSVALPLNGVVRIPCCGSATTITFEISGVDVDVINFPVVVEKV